MYSNHLRLIGTITTLGDRPPRNICQELTITALPATNSLCHHGKPNKETSTAKQEYPQFYTPSYIFNRVSVIYHHYFIWPIPFATSRRYCNKRMGGRWVGHGLYDKQNTRNDKRCCSDRML